MSKTFTNQEILDAAEAAVSERGEDYVFPNYIEGCYYSNDDGTPACIVGAIISRLDPELFAEVIEYETVDNRPHAETFAANELNYVVHSEFTYIQLAALSAAQELQDLGNPWGEALLPLKQKLA